MKSVQQLQWVDMSVENQKGNKIKELLSDPIRDKNLDLHPVGVVRRRKIKKENLVSFETHFKKNQTKLEAKGT